MTPKSNWDDALDPQSLGDTGLEPSLPRARYNALHRRSRVVVVEPWPRAGRARPWHMVADRAFAASSSRNGRCPRSTILPGSNMVPPTTTARRWRLAPEGRELELAVRHETSIGPGRGTIEAAHAWDARHEPGQTGWRIGGGISAGVVKRPIEVSGVPASFGREPGCQSVRSCNSKMGN